MGVGGPDLAPVDAVRITVAHGPGAQGCQVRAGVGLGVAERTRDLTAPDLRQQLGALRRRAELLDGRPDHRCRAPAAVVHAAVAELQREEALVPPRPSRPTELLGPRLLEPAPPVELGPVSAA